MIPTRIKLLIQKARLTKGTFTFSPLAITGKGYTNILY